MSKKNFEQTVMLSAGKSVGMVLSFTIPIFLSRHLSVETYGTYKQIMLIYWFFVVVLNQIIDTSLFYFIKHNQKETPLFSLNALLFNTLISSIVLIIFSAYADPIAELFKNPQLASHLPSLGFFIVFGISANHIDDIFLVQDKIKYRIIHDIMIEILKSITILSSFYFFNSLEIAIWGMVALMASRYLFLLAYDIMLAKELGCEISHMFKYMGKQIRFGAPLAASRVLIFLMDMEKMLISSLFGINTFTVYTVGCFENPIIHTVNSSIYDLMNIEMIEAHKNGDLKKVQYIWHTNNRKFFMILVPLTAYMMFFAETLITFIFSDKYIASTDYFLVFNLVVLTVIFSPEIVFLAFAKTKETMRIQLVSFIYTAILVISGAWFLGPIYALWGKFISRMITRVIMLSYARKLLELDFKNLMLWKNLFGITIVSILSSYILKITLGDLAIHKFFILAITFSLYTLIVFLISCFTGLISDDEIEYLKEKFRNVVLAKLK